MRVRSSARCSKNDILLSPLSAAGVALNGAGVTIYFCGLQVEPAPVWGFSGDAGTLTGAGGGGSAGASGAASCTGCGDASGAASTETGAASGVPSTGGNGSTAGGSGVVTFGACPIGGGARALS